MGARQSPGGAFQTRSILYTFIMLTNPPLLVLLIMDWSYSFPCVWIGTPVCVSELHTPPPPFGAPKFCTVLYTPPSAWPLQEWVLIHSDRCISISVGTAQPRIVLFFFILHSLDTFCVLLFFKQHSPCGTALFLIVAPLVHLNMLYCLSNPTLIHC